MIEAARQVEQQYYRQIHTKYKELGGNPQADFNVGNIEMRMVELGLSDVWMEAWKGDPKRMPIRRRRKLNERQRNAGSAATTSRGDRVNNGAAGGQASSYFQGQPQQQQQQQQDPSRNLSSYNDFAASRISTFPIVHLTPEDQEQVMADIESRGYPLDGSASPEAVPSGMANRDRDGDEDGARMGETRPRSGAELQNDEPGQRLAKRACDDIMRKGGNGIGAAQLGATGRGMGPGRGVVMQQHHVSHKHASHC